MTLPRIGEIEDVAAPDPGDEQFWSVTTIIGCLDKPALVHWAAIETAKAAVDDLGTWRSRMDHEGRQSAIDYLKGARFRTGGRLTAAALGTAAHGLFDRYAITGTRPVIVHPEPGKTLHPDDERDLRLMLDQFDRFLQEFQPAYEATEVVLFSPTYRYAGQTDGLLSIEGTPLIIDYKTSREGWDAKGKPRGPYPEVALQLAAYRHAEIAAVWRARRFENFKRRYYLLSQAEKQAGVPVPEVDGGLAIYITPHRYGVHAVRCDAAVFDRFLYAIECARWSFVMAANVVGSPMIPPHPLPVDEADPFVGVAQ